MALLVSRSFVGGWLSPTEDIGLQYKLLASNEAHKTKPGLRIVHDHMFRRKTRKLAKEHHDSVKNLRFHLYLS